MAQTKAESVSPSAKAWTKGPKTGSLRDKGKFKLELNLAAELDPKLEQRVLDH